MEVDLVFEPKRRMDEDLMAAKPQPAGSLTLGRWSADAVGEAGQPGEGVAAVGA